MDGSEGDDDDEADDDACHFFFGALRASIGNHAPRIDTLQVDLCLSTLIFFFIYMPGDGYHSRLGSPLLCFLLYT